MRVFLGLGEAELAQPLRRHPGAERVDDLLLGVGGGHEAVVLLGIIDHAEQRRPFRAPAGFEPGEAGIADGAEDFAGAVGAEVEEEDTVAVLRAGIVADYSGRDELVGFPGGIGTAQRLGDGFRAPSLAPDHRRIGRTHPLPAVVAVHRVVAPGDGDDAGALGQTLRQPVEVERGRAWRRVAAIGDRVQRHRHAGLGHHPRGGEDMAELAMHAAIGDQPHQMRGAAGGLELGDEAEDRRVAEEAPLLDGQVDLAEIHRHHAAGADIGVADLGIAHLALRQPGIGAVRGERGVRAGGHQPVEIRGPGEARGIAFLALGKPPAVEDAENHGFRYAHGAGPRLLPPSSAPPRRAEPGLAEFLAGAGNFRRKRRRGACQKLVGPARSRPSRGDGVARAGACAPDGSRPCRHPS